jgi:hypothetical protein
MAEPITATQLRKDIYKTLDRVLETGVAQPVVRNGHTFLIVPESGKRLDLSKLPKRDGLLCTPEELEATTWEWTPD